jgi:hypothetical protein
VGGQPKTSIDASIVYVLDSLFQKTPIITPKNPTVQLGDSFDETAFTPKFEIVKFQTRL